MRTPITYYGGKQLMAERIVAMMPSHRIYCEPFFGGGAVFFVKPKGWLEVINDTNDRLITFYDQCVRNFDALRERIDGTLDSERLYDKARRIYNRPRGYSKLDVAWAVWMVTNMSYSGSPRGGWKWCNGTAGSHTGVFMRGKRESFTDAVRERLAEVQISCRSANDVIRQRDSSETFFYLDPPYVGCDQKHYSGFKMSDLAELLDVLENVRGRFILSHYDNALIQEYVARNGWNTEYVNLPLMVSNLTKGRRKNEMLIYNYKIEPTLFD